MLFVLALLACGGGETAAPEPDKHTDAAPAEPAKAEVPPGGDTLETSMGAVAFHPVVHATMWITVGDKTIWVDPWTKGDLTRGPKADLILVTDIHPDHLDKAAIDAVSKPETTIVAPAAVVAEVPTAKPLANGEKIEVMGVSIEAVPMYNLQRGPEPGKLFHDKGRGNGYLLTFGDKRVYIAGDTECTPEMKALTNVDVAFVPMNLPYTMPPSEAAECVASFKPKVVYPFHYADSNLDEFAPAGVEVRKRNWYPNGLPF